MSRKKFSLEIFIHHPVLNSFRDMAGADLFRSFKIGEAIADNKQATIPFAVDADILVATTRLSAQEGARLRRRRTCCSGRVCPPQSANQSGRHERAWRPRGVKSKGANSFTVAAFETSLSRRPKLPSGEVRTLSVLEPRPYPRWCP